MAQFFVSPGEPGIVEGNYKSWVHKWTKDPPTAVRLRSMTFFIDEKNEVINFLWHQNSPSVTRFGIYNISDLSAVFESPVDSHYSFCVDDPCACSGIFLGDAFLDSCNFSRSLQTYFLMLRVDEDTIEVWRGGSSVLWSHNTSDEVASTHVYHGAISLLGKYILIVTANDKLILYEGS